MRYQSVNKSLEESFRKHWERPALSNYGGDTMCYGELARKVAKMHVCFMENGIVQGDKIALCARNQANWGVCFVAALTYGAVPVPILHEFKPENVHYLVNHSEAKILFVDEQIWDSLSEGEMPDLQTVVRVNDLSIISSCGVDPEQFEAKVVDRFASLYPGGFGPEDINYYEDKPEELALINYTSGTSGFSKGVMLPYSSLGCNMRFAGETAEPQMDCNCNIVAMLPSAHMYGMMFDFLFQISIGAHVHFLAKVPSPKIILKAFSEIKPDIIIAVPLIIEKVYKSQLKPIIEKNKVLLHTPVIRHVVRKKMRESLIEAFGGRFNEVILGGAAFNPEVENFLRSIKFPFTVGYGMTECGPIITYSKWNKCKKGACGVAVPGCRIRIDSANPYRIPGEVQVKGENVFLGYYKNREATKSCFTNDDWFKTGDMGVIDSDGYLYLRGRSKCMILGPSGQNIYPEELEAVINNVKYVIESLVVEDGGGLTALIYPDFKKAEKDGMDPAALEAHINEKLPSINKRLPSYAQIRKIEIMPEDFERTPKKSIKRYLYKRG